MVDRNQPVTLLESPVAADTNIDMACFPKPLLCGAAVLTPTLPHCFANSLMIAPPKLRRAPKRGLESA